MAVNWVPKQTGFVQRYTALVVELLQVADALAAADTEFSNNAYGTGGANAISDVVCETVLPAMSSAAFNSAEGAVVSILATVAANRGYLEILRS